MRRTLPIAFLCIASGCSSASKFGPRTEADLVMADYCYSGEWFIKHEMDEAELIQLINNDMVLYSKRWGAEVHLWCAYPTDNETVKRVATAQGIPFVEYISVVE